MDYVLQVGAYNFTREDARKIRRFYRDGGLTLWQIQEQYYPQADLNEIGMAIQHGLMDAPRALLADFMFNSDNINICTFNMGQPRPQPSGMNYLLRVGSYHFYREDARRIDRLYRNEHLSLWQIKENHYPMANLHEIAMGISHGWMDLKREQVANSMFESENINIDAYHIGEPSPRWYRDREGQGRQL